MIPHHFLPLLNVYVRTMFWVCSLSVIVGGVLPSNLYGADQVAELRAHHRSGQTFLTWKEVTLEPVPNRLSVPELLKLKDRLTQDLGVTYRVYRASQPIRTLDGLKPIAEVLSLSGWNSDLYGKYPKKEHQAFRYVIKDGAEPIPSGVGLHVHNPHIPGAVYYAVTVVIKGQEHRSLDSGNVLSQPIQEVVGQGVPVLQRVETTKKFIFVKGDITLQYYVRWENPPHVSVMGKPFDYLMAIPPRLADPAPVGLHLHSWGGSLTKGLGWWHNGEKGALFVSANQDPYDWWTGYHEKYFEDLSLKDSSIWRQGVIRPYTQQRLLAFLDWVATQWNVDRTRTFVAGRSMGGSGSAMLAIRYPEHFAWVKSDVGVHVPSLSPNFKKSYEKVYGRQEWGLLFEDGTPVWDYFNDVWYLRRYPKKDIPFITFSNGKNDKNIGWRQAVEFYQALQQTKQPHLFHWGQKGHSQRAIMPKFWEGGLQKQGRMMPIDIRTNQTLPAFTHSSLDDNPGNGDPQDGDSSGQINAHVYWLTKNIVDESQRWEMTVGVGPKAPKSEGVVDVTPRRCQKFQIKPGANLVWTNTRISDGELVQSGEVTADQWGLVTLERVTISKNLNRLAIRKADKF